MRRIEFLLPFPLKWKCDLRLKIEALFQSNLNYGIYHVYFNTILTEIELTDRLLCNNKFTRCFHKAKLVQYSPCKRTRNIILTEIIAIFTFLEISKIVKKTCIECQ